MCNIAKVSRSGFYSFKSQTENKLIRELKDLEDFELIKSAYVSGNIKVINYGGEAFNKIVKC